MKFTEDQHDAYWRKALERRMDDEDEVYRALVVLKGFRHDEDEDTREDSLYDYWNRAKRPYGTKDKEYSLAYQLGWNYLRYSGGLPLPKWVRDEARRIHNLVGDYILAS